MNKANRPRRNVPAPPAAKPDGLLRLLCERGWRKLNPPEPGRLITTLSFGPVNAEAELVARSPDGGSVLVRYTHPERGRGAEVVCVPDEFTPCDR